jgi:hypothetical protein
MIAMDFSIVSLSHRCTPTAHCGIWSKAFCAITTEPNVAMAARVGKRIFLARLGDVVGSQEKWY